LTRRAPNTPQLGIVLDAALPDPLHRQIGAQLRRAILERRLAPAARLPSSRLMAAELNCARGTVLLALDQLIAEGYVIARGRSGLSVAADLPDDALVSPAIAGRAAGAPAAGPILSHRTVAQLARAAADPSADGPHDHSPIAFPLGQPDRTSFPFRLWAKLLDEEWQSPGWEIAGAPHPFGHPGLRQAIVDYLGVARGFSCEPASVVVTTGVRQSLSLFARIVLDAGEEAWIEDPCFPGTRDALAAAEVRAVMVPIDREGFSPQAAQAVAPRARLAVVAPSHQFPLGTVLSLQRRLTLLEWAERTGSWVVEDDFDGEYRYSGRPLAPLRALDRAGRVAYLGSFSKLLFPALRLSFMVLPASLAAATETIMARLSARASLIAQGALARFIADGHLVAHLRRTRLLYGGRQQALLAAAARHLGGRFDVAADAGGMHLIARPHSETRFDDRAATAAAAARGVRVSPLSACYAGAHKADGLLLGYAGTPDAEIEPAVMVLKEALAP
jgi:GntR family transcriptional regulator / MocR family aminotransferase